ncbi:MAG: 4-hydroxy-tetrahydrodipicolinate reductase [Gemmatimonadota bacterium]
MANRTRILVSGAAGRMGRTVARLAAESASMEVVGGLDRETPSEALPHCPRVLRIEEAGDLLATADVIVDFSAPEFLRRLLASLAELDAPPALVVGTTGLGDDEAAMLSAASRRVAVLTAANFSIGVNLLLVLAERAAASLGEGFDIEIVEAHHRRKEDAPSGTALALGEAVAEGRNVHLPDVRRDGRSGRPGARPEREIGFHSLRGGDVIGDHHVHFIGDLERIELTHRASDRALFAAGALRAAAWLNDQPSGRYSMLDVLGL